LLYFGTIRTSSKEKPFPMIRAILLFENIFL